MEFTEKVSALQSSAENQLPALNSLKKTETALVLPFFDVLGYNPFDVRDVEPDFNVGLGDKGMRTVDYALKREGAPLMLFQCEEAKTDLGDYDSSFLFEHFDALGADVAVFTNGLTYRFYANLGAEINVAQRPFLEFDLLDHGPEQVEGLQQLTKSAFDAEEIISTAYALKSGRLLRHYLVQQQESPDEHLVRFIAAQIFEGEVSEDVVERFRPVVQNVLGDVVEGEAEIPQPVPSSEDNESEPRPPEDDVLNSPEEEELELSPSEEESIVDEAEDQEENGDPFEKDLARRVIEDF